MAAELIAALSLFFDFAVAAGGLTSDERDQRLADCTAALKALAAAQADHQAAEDPVRRFLDLVGAAIAAQRAHVAERALRGGTAGRPGRVGLGTGAAGEAEPGPR